MQSRYRSELVDAAKLTAILKKIKELAAERPRALIIEKAGVRYLGEALTSFTIDETVDTATIVFDDGGGAQTYDKADIKSIQRVRSRKYKIVLKPDANPAA